MVEMDELATILREADERSLVLLDEVGRGTSTADGLAIARAITEHVHDEVGATTLFATHHHPLTELADDLQAAFPLHFEVEGVDDEVVFHHEIASGAATGSYGIEVATAAGVPETVVERSRNWSTGQQVRPTQRGPLEISTNSNVYTRDEIRRLQAVRRPLRRTVGTTRPISLPSYGHSIWAISRQSRR